MLTDFQIERYSRQILLPRVGGRGQEAFLAARICIVGERLVARTAARHLAAAGVGHLDIHSPADSHVPSTSWELTNPECNVTFHHTDTGEFREPDLVLHTDGTTTGDRPRDGWHTRRLLGFAAGCVATVLDAGHLCRACAEATRNEGEARTRTIDPLDAVTEVVAGALLAQEALLLLLTPESAAGRRIDVDVGGAAARTSTSPVASGCVHAVAPGNA